MIVKVWYKYILTKCPGINEWYEIRRLECICIFGLSETIGHPEAQGDWLFDEEIPSSDQLRAVETTNVMWAVVRGSLLKSTFNQGPQLLELNSRQHIEQIILGLFKRPDLH